MNQDNDNNTDLILEFKFITGRYHATQWGKNVNEGIIDWPPSPWRILRAIISTWKLYTKFEDEKVVPILNKMCKSKVTFHIPNAVQSHTRHYMPYANNRTEKIIDSFIMMEKDQSVYAIWSMLNLDSSEESVLNTLIKKIRYIGRAESWCQVNLHKQKITPNCIPLNDAIYENNLEIIDVMLPTNDATLSDLCIEASRTYKEQMSRPKGSRIIQYLRPHDCLTKIESNSARDSNVEVVRYMVVGNVPPDITQTITIGDSIKRSVMSIYGRQNNNEVTYTLSGKDKNREKLKGNNHASYIPTDENSDGKLDHVTIITKNRFTEQELSALSQLKTVRYGQSTINLVYEASGLVSDFHKVPILQTSKRWASVTPFVLNRHMKLRGVSGNKVVVDGPVDQLKREIRKKFGGDIQIKNITICDSKSSLTSNRKPIQFKRWRKDKLPGFGAYNVKIEFETEIQGPLLFGHGAHYGLGMFIPY